MKNQVGARLVFQNAVAALTSALTASYPNKTADQIADMVANAVLSQSVLRLEQPISTATTNYQFPVLNNQTTGSNTIRVTEKRLNIQDSFYISDIGVYLANYTSTTSNVGTLATYPNPVTFSTSGAAAAYQAIYNAGYLNLLVNGSTIVPAMDLQRFEMVPQTQALASVTGQSTEFYGAGDYSAQCVIEPNLLFIGAKNNQLGINMLGNAVTVAGSSDYIVIMVRGILMQNVTVVS